MFVENLVDTDDIDFALSVITPAMKHRFGAAAAVSFFVIPEQHRGNVHTEKLAFQYGKTGDHLIAIVVSGLVVWIALLAEYADGGGLLQHSVESVLGVGTSGFWTLYFLNVFMANGRTMWISPPSLSNDSANNRSPPLASEQ